MRSLLVLWWVSLVTGSGISILGNGRVIPQDGEQIYPTRLDGTIFMSACVGKTSKRTFKIKNSKSEDADLASPAVRVVPYNVWGGNALPSEFSLRQPQLPNVPGNSEVDFDVFMTPVSKGEKYGTVHVDISDGSNFFFNVGGDIKEQQVSVVTIGSDEPVNFPLRISEKFPLSVDYIYSDTIQLKNDGPECAVQVKSASVENEFRAVGQASWSPTSSDGGFSIILDASSPLLDSFDARVIFLIRFASTGPGDYRAVVTLNDANDAPITSFSAEANMEGPTLTPTNKPTESPTSAPTSMTQAPTTCSDKPNQVNPEKIWEDYDGYTCEWYNSVATYCETYGQEGKGTQYQYANDVCCICGGGMQGIDAEEENNGEEANDGEEGNDGEEANDGEEKNGKFDFQSCNGGVGSFITTLDNPDATSIIGIVPTGQVDLYVRLTADTDIDIRLYDMNAVEHYPEGVAIVGWCEDVEKYFTAYADSPKTGTCNLGLLGSGNEESTVYKGMSVYYTGYDGVTQDECGGKAFPCKGVEYIRITGATTVPLMMSAFAFETGKVQVNYSWTYSFTGCCANSELCEDTFQVQVPTKAVIELGDIPAGVNSLNITLTADGPNDLDIQIYDKSRKNLPIIAWCDDNIRECPFAETDLGNKQGFASTVYNASLLTYSGYDGVGGRKGNEFIRINVTNTEMNMRVYGYEAGNCSVHYTYMNGPPDAEWIAAFDEATKETENDTCQDKQGTLGEWYDSAGSQYNCNWYGADTMRCEQYGGGSENFNLVANQACCACGGGEISDANPFLSFLGILIGGG